MNIELEEAYIEDYVNTNLYLLSFNQSHLKSMSVLNIICKILAIILLLLGFILLMIGKYLAVILALVLATPMFFMYRIQLKLVRVGLKNMFKGSINQNGHGKSIFSIDQEDALYQTGKVSVNTKTCDIQQIRETTDYFFVHLDALIIVGLNKKNLPSLASSQQEFRSYSSLYNFPYIIDNQWDNNPYKKYKK